MSGPFSLDVDGAAVAAAARDIGDYPSLLTRNGRTIDAVPATLAATWRGRAADSAGRETRALGGHVTAAAVHFDRASDALRRLSALFADASEVAVPRLNHEWARVQSMYADATYGAHRAYDLSDPRMEHELAYADNARQRREDELRGEFDALVRSLEHQTRVTSQTLAHAVIVPVSPLAAAAYGHFGFLGSVASSLLAPNGFGALDDLSLARIGTGLAQPPRDVDALAKLLASARAAGFAPADYADALSAYWKSVALRDAGIDGATWDPAAGADANRKTIEAVYRYYGDLYLKHPELEWAGMANMIGPSFAGGFLDLATIRRVAGDVAGVPQPLRGLLPPGVTELAHMSAEEFHYYETTLLTMQRDIFMDQGSMHAAYVQGGLGAIEEMTAAGIVDTPTSVAWHHIDRGKRTGDVALLRQGNGALLNREQFDVIADSYDVMRAHAPSGEAMTWLMTLVGAPSIPGARSYGEVMPLTASMTTPGPRSVSVRGVLGTVSPLLTTVPALPLNVLVPRQLDVRVDNPLQATVTVTTPLPDGNVADRWQRWDLIQRDTLPAYTQLLDTDPIRARAIIAQPVGDRIQHYRIDETWDDLTRRLSDWRLDVDQ
jgi:hypothetical protein